MRPVIDAPLQPLFVDLQHALPGQRDRESAPPPHVDSTIAGLLICVAVWRRTCAPNPARAPAEAATP
jgi:hypothetical protein